MRCWYSRWQLSNALDRGDLASRIQRGHAASCAACQSYATALQSLHHRLSRDVHAAPAPAPIAAVRHLRWPAVVAGAMAAGAAAMVLVFVLGGGGGAGAPVANEPPLSVAPGDTAPDPSGDSPVRVPSVVAQVSQSLTTPLEAELDALIDDSRRGVKAILAVGGLRTLR